MEYNKLPGQVPFHHFCHCLEILLNETLYNSQYAPGMLNGAESGLVKKKIWGVQL